MSSPRSSAGCANSRTWVSEADAGPGIDSPAVAQEDTRIVELDDLLVRPGTYFNPQTEVVVVVVDDVSIDQEIFNMERYEGADWVRISDEVPVDSDDLDTTMQRFQTDHVDVDALTETKFAEDLDDEGEDDDLDADDEEDVDAGAAEVAEAEDE